jgi:hypothetical protein
MPVNINEFEVVMDNAHAEPSPNPDTASQAAASRGATPHEIENILRREKERLARVLAL